MAINQLTVGMTVEETIKDMITNYQGLFQSRTGAIHHLFVVLGCGYNWVDGELVDHDTDPSGRDPMPDEAVAILVRHREKLDHVYPWCDLCNLNNIPKDIKPDWLEASKEAREDLNRATV